MRCRRLVVSSFTACLPTCVVQARYTGRGSQTGARGDGVSAPAPPSTSQDAASEETPQAHVDASAAAPDTTVDTTQTAVSTSADHSASTDDDLNVAEPEPLRWVQEAYQDPDKMPIVDERGEYIVSKGNWPTGEVAYSTPAPVDDKLAPRFGYNVVSVRKHVSWWKYNQKYPSFSLAYVNIQVIFILGIAWLCAFLTDEYRRVSDEMKTPGAMVGEHRGRGPETSKTQRVAFTKSEMGDLVNRAQDNWMDGKAEASYIGSKEYKMRKIPRPEEFSTDDFRKR